MKTSHSSLLADTGLSEIELDRMGLTPVERDGDQLCPLDRTRFERSAAQTSAIGRVHSGTLAPFKGTHWYDDEDVETMLRWAKAGYSTGYKL